MHKKLSLFPDTRRIIFGSKTFCKTYINIEMKQKW